MIRMVGGWAFLLVPAHPGSPGQRTVKRLLLLLLCVRYLETRFLLVQITRAILCRPLYCQITTNTLTVITAVTCSAASVPTNTHFSYYHNITLLASQSWCKGSNAPSIRSQVVDEERMRPGHRSGLVLCVPFSALTMTVRSTNPQEVLFRNRSRTEVGTTGARLT